MASGIDKSYLLGLTRRWLSGYAHFAEQTSAQQQFVCCGCFFWVVSADLMLMSGALCHQAGCAAVRLVCRQCPQQQSASSCQLDGAADSALQIWCTGAAAVSSEAGQCSHTYGSDAQSSGTAGQAAAGASYALSGVCAQRAMAGSTAQHIEYACG